MSVVWIELQHAGDLAGALEAARWDESARVVVLDGTRGVADSAPGSKLATYPLPVVFAFEGTLTGAATDVALAADVRICGASASLVGPIGDEARWRLLVHPASVPAPGAGVTVNAEELLRLGLVNEVAPAGSAAEAARRFADVVASRGPIATRLAKEAIWRGLPQPMEQALRFETDLTLLLQTTKDRAEGVSAFLEKRQPVFKGE